MARNSGPTSDPVGLGSLVSEAVDDDEQLKYDFSAAEDALEATPPEGMRERARAARQAEDAAEPDAQEDSAPETPPSVNEKKYTKRDLARMVERLQADLAQAQRDRDAAQETQHTEKKTEGMDRLAMTIEFAARMGFNVMARVRGPHWKVDDERAETIGGAGALALAPYAAAASDWLPMIQFAVVLGGTIGERIAEDKRIMALKQEPIL